MPHASINGASLFYDEAGQGEVVLFHHGYTGSHDSWAGVTPKLSERYRCIWMDCRGAGDSEHSATGYTIEQYADDVIGLIEHLGIDRFTYVGHSMGGVVGMELGLRYPERLNKLVLVAPAPADGVQAPPEVHERSARLRAERAREQMIFERSLTTARPGSQEQIAAAVDRALSVSDGHFRDSWQALIDFKRGDEIAAITTPTLMIAGAADALLTANLKDFQRLPNAALHVFSRVSHGIPREVPDEFAEVVGDFLEHGVVTSATLMERLQTATA